MKNKIFLFLTFTFLMACKIFAQSIKGVIVDSKSNKPIAGVSVQIEGTNTSVQSNEQGEFNIKATKPLPIQLKLSYTGFQTLTILVTKENIATIKLVPQDVSLDEIVVIGYGTVKKRDLTGSVVSIKGTETTKIAAGNAIEALQGKVAGIDIVRSNGGAGSTPSITIRGNRSINANNGPLYIVDGIQYGNYQDINPSDIQSFEVLKDASSTAIYGSRGANGVIIITTKSGIVGTPKISLSLYNGNSEVTGYPSPMNAQQFADLKRQANRTLGRWKSNADDALIFNALELANINSGVSYNYPNLLLNKGAQSDYNVSVSTGTDKTKLFFSYDYYSEKGVLVNDYSNRHTFRLNVEQSLASNLVVGFQNQLTYYDQNLRQDNVLTQAYKVIPYYSPNDSTGALVKFPGSGSQFNSLFNDVSGNYINNFVTTRILSNGFLNWKIVKGLTFRTNLGITNTNTRNGYYSDASSLARSNTSGSISSITSLLGTDITWENILNYKIEVKKHQFGATVLTSFIKSVNENQISSGTGQLIKTQTFYALQNNPNNISINSNYVKNVLFSSAFRLNYSYDNKYLLTITGRNDEASVLSEQNRSQFFPSIAVAWRVSDENFMKNVSFISDLKLRVSGGIAGNSAVAPYSSQSGLFLIPYSWNDALSLAYGLSQQTGNPNLKWELSATNNYGLDIGFLNQRITASLDYYDTRTSDLLLQRSLPTSSGVKQVIQNIGKTKNSGIELTIQANVIKTKFFNWNSSVTYTMNKEEIVDLVNGQNDVANAWFIGSPVNSFYDYKKIGIWQTEDSNLAKSFGYKPGDIKVADINGDGKITSDDRTIIGSTTPKYILSFNNDFTIGNFDLNIFIFARQGQTIKSNFAAKYEPNAIENGTPVDYWTPENPTNNYPRPTTALSRAALPFATSLQYIDGSFIKIRNITLGYTLPLSISQKLKIKKLRVYMSAKNFITFSNIKNFDPENAGSYETPLTKLFVAGVNIDF